MMKWWRFCRILKRLNVIDVNSEYCVKRVNFLFCLRFIHYKDVLFKSYDLRSSDVKKKLNSDVKIWYPTFFMVSMMLMCFSNDKMVQWQSLGYSEQVWCSLSACDQMFSLALCRVLFGQRQYKHLTSVFLRYVKGQFFPRKHVLMSLGLSYHVYSQATQPWRL